MIDVSKWRCPECGFYIKLMGGSGRTRLVKSGFKDIPADFLIPTCTNCGEEVMTPEISDVLDKLLEDT
jgi:rubredoxin